MRRSEHIDTWHSAQEYENQRNKVLVTTKYAEPGNATVSICAFHTALLRKNGTVLVIGEKSRTFATIYATYTKTCKMMGTSFTL